MSCEDLGARMLEAVIAAKGTLSDAFAAPIESNKDQVGSVAQSAQLILAYATEA